MKPTLLKRLEEIRRRYLAIHQAWKALNNKSASDVIARNTAEIQGKGLTKCLDGIIINNENGGPGSGNHGHAGVPGVRGGSAPSGTLTVKGTGKLGFDKQAHAKTVLMAKSAPIGTVVESKESGRNYQGKPWSETRIYTKTDEDEWKCECVHCGYDNDGQPLIDENTFVRNSTSLESEVTNKPNMGVQKEVSYATPNGEDIEIEYPSGQLSDLYAEAYLSDTSGEWEGQLTKEQKKALCSYTHKGDKKINGALRTRDGIEDEKTQNRIKAIDSAIDSYELRRDVKVYRGTSSHFLGYDGEIDDSIIGTIISDAAYTSTTVDRSITNHFEEAAVKNDRKAKIKNSQCVTLELDIPSGKGRGAYISGAAYKDAVSEREFLVKRGASFEIYDYKKDTDGYVVKGRWVE